MTPHEPPGMDLSMAMLPMDAKQRHEEIVDLFGQYIMWMRSRAIESSRQFVESQQLRDQLGTIHRSPYEEAAKLLHEDRKRAYDLAEATLDGFIELFLRVLSHRGVDFPFGTHHAIRYLVAMEILEKDSEDVVLQEIINRDGRKHFADYWGRWLNRSSTRTAESQ